MVTTDIVTQVRSSDPDTSRRAAELLAPKLSKLQTIVLNIFRTVPDFGLTDSELDSLYVRSYADRGWPMTRFETPRKRRSDLTRMGLLEDSGIRRMNPYGRLEVVWVLR